MIPVCRRKGYPPVHGNMSKTNIRRLKHMPANAARLTQLASIFVIPPGIHTSHTYVPAGLCPPYFIQHQNFPVTLCLSKMPEFADSRIPAVLVRKTVIRKSKYFILHVRRELPNPARETPPPPGHVAAAKGGGIRNNGWDSGLRNNGGDSATTEGTPRQRIHHG